MAYAPPDQFMASPPPDQSVTSPPLYPTNVGMPYQPPGPPPPPLHQPYYAPQGAPTAAMFPPPPVIVQPMAGFLGHNPQATQCVVCQQQIITQVRYEAGGITWLIAFLICFFGGFIGCCLIPFCLPGCQDAIHTCPACHNTIGRKSPF